MDPSQLKFLLIEPVLRELGLFSVAALNLLLGTAMVESNLMYIRQLPRGPALGLYQCEPATHDDIWTWLDPQAELRSKVSGFVIRRWPLPPPADLLVDALYATVICRMHYWRVPEPLPPSENAAALSSYHKRYYNTYLGAADPVANTPIFQKAIDTRP